MIFYIPFICSTDPFSNLKKKFEDCYKACLLSKPNISNEEREKYCEQFTIQNQDLGNGKNLYFDLIGKYNKVYNLVQLKDDFTKFYRCCFYVDKANLTKVYDKLHPILDKLDEYAKSDLKMFASLSKYLKETENSDYIQKIASRNSPILSFYQIAGQKIVALSDLKNKFKYIINSCKFKERNVQTEISPLDEDLELLNILTPTLKNLTQLESKIDDLANKISQISLNEGEKLFNEFKTLLQQIEIQCSKPKHSSNKYLLILELESEIKYKEFTDLRFKLDLKRNEIGKKFDEWSQKLPEKSFDSFDDKISGAIDEFTNDVNFLLKELLSLQTQIKEIPFDVSVLSFTQKLKYLLMNKYGDDLEKLKEIKNKCKTHLSNLKNSIKKYKEFINSMSKISTLHKTMLTKRFVSKSQPSISKLIDGGFIEMEGDNASIKYKPTFENELDGLIYRFDAFGVKIKKESRFYQLIIGTLFVLIVFSIIVVVLILSRT